MYNAEKPLYTAGDGSVICSGDILSKLKKVGADDCEMLFIHTDISFGVPCRGIKRGELLEALSDILLELGVKTIVLPTFTYSFANGEEYDIISSKTSMGVLLEYMRKLPQVSYRTADPLLSLTIIGDGAEQFTDLPHNSLGPDSAFDRIHRNGRAKFLMFGGQFGESFTYTHHVEKMMDVPYRYDQFFTGTIVEPDGCKHEETWSIHTACGGVLPRNFYDLEDELVERGLMRREILGDSKLVCISEPIAYSEIEKKILSDINYFLKKPFTQEDLRREYQYGKNGERVTHC